jgi:hypothetical protein
MNSQPSSGGFAEVNSDDALYRDLQLRGTNRRFVGNPDSVYVVDDTSQVVSALNATVAAGKKLAVRAGGHCVDGLVDDPSVRSVIDLAKLDSVSYDSQRRAFAVEAGATLGRVYRELDMSWGVTLPGGSCTAVGMGGHAIGGGYGPLSRLYGMVSDHLYAVETVVVGSDGKAKTMVATREADDPRRDLFFAHTGGGGGNFGVATKFWFRTRGATGSDPTRLLPKRPSGFTMGSMVWPWASLDEAKFTTLVNNFQQYCAENKAPGTPAAAVNGNLVLFHKAFGAVSLSAQIDPAQPQSSAAMEAFFTQVSANVPGGNRTTRENLPWQYTTLNAPEVSDAIGLPAAQIRSKTKGAFLRTAMDATQIRTIYQKLIDETYNWRGATAVFSTWAGKINALAPQDTAVSERSSIMLFGLANFWDQAAEDNKHLTWNRTLYRDIFATTGGVPVPGAKYGGLYVNWPDPDLLESQWNSSGVSAFELYHGVNLAKLRQAKAKYDPRRVFNHALSVPPA